MFLGAMVFFLSFLGALLSRQRKKHIIIWITIFILGLNSVSDQSSVFSFAHWINALTNPFHCLDRSFHMTALLWPFMTIPLIALGLEACWALVNRRLDLVYLDRVPVAIGFCFGLAVLFILWQAGAETTYTLGSTFLVILFLFFSWQEGAWSKYRKILSVVIFVILLGLDVHALQIYINALKIKVSDVKEYSRSSLANGMPLVLDYQNPKVFSSRLFYNTNPVDYTLDLYTQQNTFGSYYQFTPLPSRYLKPTSMYMPRSMAYKEMASNVAVYNYLQKDGRMVFFAPYAIDGQLMTLGSILSNNLDRQVIRVNDPKAPGLIDPAREVIKFQPLPGVRIRNFNLNFDHSKQYVRSNGIEYQIKLPQDFPKYVSTVVFGGDINAVQLSIEGTAIRPVQGWLAQPFTFDVQNVKEKTVSIFLPKDFNVVGKKMNLAVSSFEDIVDIWSNSNDRFGFTYQAPRPGWLVLHYPYDPKWQLSIDGTIVRIYRVNDFFIGAPINAGEHKVLLEYWPNTPLRTLLIISVILVMLTFGFIIRESFRRE